PNSNASCNRASTRQSCWLFAAIYLRPVNPSHRMGEEGDGYSYEEEAERTAVVKATHLPLKRWYNAEEQKALREEHGTFPMFWQDLAKWEHWKAVHKLFLVATEGPVESKDGETGKAAEGAAPAEGGAGGAESAAATDASNGAGGEPKKRSRKGRWGEAKKSRWGNKDVEEGGVKKKKSRWSADPAAAANEVPALPLGQPVSLTPEQIQETLVLQLKLKQVNDKMTTVVADAKAKEADPDRSPSPPPKYDSNGVRTNTREVRMRDALQVERSQVLEAMMSINPLFRPPADFVKTKPSNKLYIPTKEYPGYNFIGLIIGPRGNTQKRMEKETGCKIAIRGKGSVKEGSRKTKSADEDDELHVFITGDSQEMVDKASAEVEGLLKPVDDEKNQHKQKQLRELALINGTLREDEFCHICGEKGHRQFECPQRASQRKSTVEVRCAICGDTSHPTRDCSMKNPGQGGGVTEDKAVLDKEYMNFMAELGGGPAPPAASAATPASGSGGSSSAPTSQSMAPPPAPTPAQAPPQAPPNSQGGFPPYGAPMHHGGQHAPQPPYYGRGQQAYGQPPPHQPPGFYPPPPGPPGYYDPNQYSQGPPGYYNNQGPPQQYGQPWQQQQQYPPQQYGGPPPQWQQQQQQAPPPPPPPGAAGQPPPPPPAGGQPPPPPPDGKELITCHSPQLHLLGKTCRVILEDLTLPADFDCFQARHQRQRMVMPVARWTGQRTES
ncbi:unnamed protein product, partial [Chrysoparadoxa australica]